MENGKAKRNERLQGLLKNKYMLFALGALGVFLLFNPLEKLAGNTSPSPTGTPSALDQPVATVNADRPTMAQYEQMYEQRLREILNTVAGVNDVSVMVNIDSSEEMIYAENIQQKQQTTQENTKGGDTRTITDFDKSNNLVMKKDGGTDQPVMLKVVKPRVRGVVVTAKGAEDVKVRAVITDAVQRALEVPPHKISILPKKSNS